MWFFKDVFLVGQARYFVLYDHNLYYYKEEPAEYARPELSNPAGTTQPTRFILTCPPVNGCP